MKTSWRKLLVFSQVSQGWLANNRKVDAEGKPINKLSKLEYAINRVTPQLAPLQAKVMEHLEDIDIDFCSVDKEGNILKDAQGGYKYTPKKLKERNKERITVFDKEDLEIEHYYATVVPNTLTEYELASFSGIVIDPEKIDELRAKQEENADDEVEETETPAGVNGEVI